MKALKMLKYFIKYTITKLYIIESHSMQTIPLKLLQQHLITQYLHNLKIKCFNIHLLTLNTCIKIILKSCKGKISVAYA